MRTLLFLVCTLVLGTAVHARDIYRCVTPSGEVTLTNVKCPANTSVHLIGTYEPVPDAPTQRLDAAIQAADISAQQAREAALRAQSAANQATRLLDQGMAEPQGYEPSGGDPNTYVPAWLPGYAFDGQFDARFPGRRHHMRSYAQRPYPDPHQSLSRHAHSANAYPQFPKARLAFARPVPPTRPTAPPPAVQPRPATARHW